MTEVQKSMKRVRRAAATLTIGDQLLRFIRSDAIRRKLVDGASDEDTPPVTLISDDLVEEFGADEVTPMPVRQFIGMAVKAVLAEEGFEVAEANVRIHNDAIFRSGSVYRPILEEEPATSDGAVFRAMIAGLDEAQLRHLQKAVEQALA